MGFDPVEEIRLVCEKSATQVQQLLPDGSRKNVKFRAEDGALVVETPVYTLNPVILFLK